MENRIKVMIVDDILSPATNTSKYLKAKKLKYCCSGNGYEAVMKSVKNRMLF